MEIALSDGLSAVGMTPQLINLEPQGWAAIWQ